MSWGEMGWWLGSWGDEWFDNKVGGWEVEGMNNLLRR